VSPAFQAQNFNLKIEGKMTFWGKIYIDNEGKNKNLWIKN
jgi:hypothetical protein